MTTYDPGEVGRSRSIDSGIPATGWRHLVTASDLTGRLALAGAIAVGLAVPLIWVAAQFYAPIDHDTGAILYFSDRWWAGERLYVDLIDVNPPLVFILGLLPVLIRQWTGLPEPAALIACVAATSILSTFVVWRLLAWRAGQLGRGEPGTLTSILVPLALLFALLTPGELGQREHLMVVLTVPYVVLTALRLEGRRVPLVIALGIAMAAAAGFALKPFFLLVPALIELFVLWVRRGQALRDPVPWTMGAMWAAYVGLTLLAFPEYGDVILPMTLEFYSRLGDSSPLVAFNRGFLPIEAGIGVLAIVTVLMVRSRLCQTLALFAIGTAITTIVQGKGWSHQWLHADLAFILLGRPSWRRPPSATARPTSCASGAWAPRWRSACWPSPTSPPTTTSRRGSGSTAWAMTAASAGRSRWSTPSRTRTISWPCRPGSIRSSRWSTTPGRGWPAPT